MMRAIVDEVLSDLSPHGTVDLITDFAEKLPARLIAGLLGMERDGACSHHGRMHTSA